MCKGVEEFSLRAWNLPNPADETLFGKGRSVRLQSSNLIYFLLATVIWSACNVDSHDPELEMFQWHNPQQRSKDSDGLHVVSSNGSPSTASRGDSAKNLLNGHIIKSQYHQCRRRRHFDRSSKISSRKITSTSRRTAVSRHDATVLVDQHFRSLSAHRNGTLYIYRSYVPSLASSDPQGLC